MSVLLLADIVNGYLNREVTAKAINAVQSLGSVTVLCAGSQAQVAGTYVAQIAGVTNVVTVESSLYDHNLAEPMAALLVSISDAFSYVVAPSTSDSKNILPRVAALLDVMMISDVSAVISGDTFERSAYAGSVIQKVKSRDSKKILTIRTANFNAAPDGGNAPVSSAEPAGNSGLSEWVEDVMAITERPDLTSAKRVVSGGRGLASKENFALIEKCADKIGAAVDAGFVPNDLQVGQTGKVVAPELYVAIGISGAIQHLAGMKDSKVIVAINKDEDAPIFKIADFGIVGDLFEVIPQLTDCI